MRTMNERSYGIRLSLLAFLFFSQNAMASQDRPKLRVKVLPVEDQWVTFGDGQRLKHGAEVPVLLAEYLFRSENFTVTRDFRVPKEGELGVQSVGNPNAYGITVEELERRLPSIDFKNVRSKLSDEELGVQSNHPFESKDNFHIVIRPEIKTLIYVSGERSNRLVYGFSPTTLNDFNNSNVPHYDNEFTSQSLGTQNQCERFDFFNGEIDPKGYGFKNPTFGSNFDEGFDFSILGYGIGFRKKSYKVKSEIVFHIEAPHLGTSETVEVQINAGGRSLYFGGQFSGVGLAIEWVRRETLTHALRETLPKTVTELISKIPDVAWQTDIVASDSVGIQVSGGFDENLQPGMRLLSSFGAIYEVSEMGVGVSEVRPLSTNATKPFVGEVLRHLDGNSNPWYSPSTLGVLSASVQQIENKVVKEITIIGDIDPKTLQEKADLCFKKDIKWHEELLNGLFSLYGYYRYKNVFDQSFEKITAKSDGKKIAIVASGIYPKSKKLKKYLDNSGFDFLSRDDRPSDELGLGTALSRLIVENIDSNITLVPIKVLGPRGEVHSSELFEALEHVSKRSDVAMVVLPFVPSFESEAYRRGIALNIRAGKTVVVPSGTQIEGVTESPKASKVYKVKDMKTQLEIGPIATGVGLKVVELIKNGILKK